MSCRRVQSIDPKKKKKRDQTENSIFTLILFIWKQFDNVQPKYTRMFPHLVAVLLSVTIRSQFWNVKAVAVLQDRTRCPGGFSSQRLRSLQLECFWYWLSSLSDCVGDSGSVPGLLLLAGGSFPPHMWLQLREGKGPVPESGVIAS